LFTAPAENARGQLHPPMSEILDRGHPDVRGEPLGKHGTGDADLAGELIQSPVAGARRME
jgi:hypothetical protein